MTAPTPDQPDTEPVFTSCTRCGAPTDERVLCQDCIDADMDWEDHQYNDSRYGL